MIKTKFKKVTLLTIIVLILGSAIFTNTSSARNNITSAPLEYRGSYSSLIRRGDLGILTAIIVHEVDGVEFPAYCIQRELPGAQYGTYTVSVNNLISDVRVWRAIINGYPYRTPAELGVAT